MAVLVVKCSDSISLRLRGILEKTNENDVYKDMYVCD